MPLNNPYLLPDGNTYNQSYMSFCNGRKVCFCLQRLHTTQSSRPSRELSIYLVITKANKVLSLCVSLYRAIQLELLVQIIISVFSDLGIGWEKATLQPSKSKTRSLRNRWSWRFYDLIVWIWERKMCMKLKFGSSRYGFPIWLNAEAYH